VARFGEPDVSHIPKGFLSLSINPTAPAVAAGYDRLRFAYQRLSSQQSLDSNGTVATAPIKSHGGTERGQWRLRDRRHWRSAPAAATDSPPNCGESVGEGAMLLTADKLNAAMKRTLLSSTSNFTRRFSRPTARLKKTQNPTSSSPPKWPRATSGSRGHFTLKRRYERVISRIPKMPRRSILRQ